MVELESESLEPKPREREPQKQFEQELKHVKASRISLATLIALSLPMVGC